MNMLHTTLAFHSLRQIGELVDSVSSIFNGLTLQLNEVGHENLMGHLEVLS